jgi:hypothetical protein
MSHVRGEIRIDRPVDEVFDYVADERNEPSYNPAMVRVEKLTDGPVGAGTRYRATVVSMGRQVDMLIETTIADRPATLSSVTTMRSARITGTLTFVPEHDATQMTWDWDVTPTGPARILSPVITSVGRRQEAAIWCRLKDVLESAPGH